MDKKKKIFKEAKKTINDEKKLSQIVSKAIAKLKNLAANSPEWKELQSKVRVLIKMMKSQVSGEYKAFSTSSLLLVVFALLYFITPIDAIPDFIPGIGLMDDASILLLIYKRLSKDIDAYLAWREAK